MITSVTIEYALPYETNQRFVYDAVSTSSESVAFDEAVEELKLRLLEDARTAIPSNPFQTADEKFRKTACQILRLKPWAHSYEYGSVDPASLGIDTTKEGWFTEYKRRTEAGA